MNSQFVAGLPPPLNPQMNPMQHPSGPGMPPPLNNGANYNQYNQNINSQPNVGQPNINQKMQSLNLGSPQAMPQQGVRPFANGPNQQFSQPPFGGQQPPPPKQLNDNQPGPPHMAGPPQMTGPIRPQMGLPPMNDPQRPPNANSQHLPPGAPTPQLSMPPMSQPSLPPMSQPSAPPMSQPMSFPNQPGSPPNQPMGYPNQPGLPPTSQPMGFQNQPAPQGYPKFPPGANPGDAPNQMPPFQNQMPPFQNQAAQNQIPPFQNHGAKYPVPVAGHPPNAQLPPGAPPPYSPPKMPPLPGQAYQPAMPPKQMQGPPGGPGFMNPPQPGLQSPQGPQMGYPNQQPGFPAQQNFPAQPGYPNQQGGYPPQQPPFPGQQPSYPGQQAQFGYQQQSAKKLNPDQMPSPIQVMTDDQNAHGGVFTTNTKGCVPPLVTTEFVVVDQGNASPRYIRSSMYNVPATNEMMKQTAVPFCVVLSPMAEEAEEEHHPPLLDFSILTGVPGNGPVRCGRCKAYMCPAMKFVDAGRHFQCAFCKATTEVPMEYTQYLNNNQHYGQGTPEMSLGCYEIVATKEYCRNNVLPNPPAMIFVIDVSYNAIRSGMVNLIIGRLRSIVANLKTPPRIGIITYSSTIHFYNINEKLGQPQMMVVGDIQDVFVPLARGLLAEPGQVDHLFEALSQQIPLMFRETKETETILLPAVQAGLEALKAAECCGKLLVFHSALPSAQAPGQLMNRDDRKLLGTEKEKSILMPQTKVYNELAQECVGNGCGVELFLFNNAYTDVATIGQLARLTGGGIYKYTYFQADIDGERVIEDLNRVLTRPTAFDAVMRVRTSTGVRATDFYGHFFMSNTTDVELATLDSDKAIAVEIKHDDKLTGEDGVYIQVALLYTHISGQRRLRICNLSLNVATQMVELYRSCDLDTFINFLSKQAISRLSEHSPKSIKEGIIARCAQTLACYRKHCATPSSVGQLVLPESMKLLPLYANCLLRSDALSGGPDITCDDRSWAMQAVLCADVDTSVGMFYPRLLCLNPLASGVPAEPVRCILEKLRDDSIFLLENSVYMMLWVGLQTSPELLKSLFGVNTVAEINPEVAELPVLNTPFNESVRDLIDMVRKQRRRCMRLTIVKQNDKLEMVFRHFLVEDDGRNGASSYMDFLCHLHKEIRALL